MSTAREQYDELWSGAWGDMQAFGPVHRHSLERLLAIVNPLPVKSVLDVGCGAGHNLYALAASGKYHLAGIDVSHKALEMARGLVPEAEFHLMDVQAQTLDARFDLVISLQVIEHIPDDLAVIRNMRRMSNRYVMIATMQGKMRASESRIGHLRNYSSKELVEKMKSVGLKPVRVEGWGFPFYSPLYRTVAEWLPGGPPDGPMGGVNRFVAGLLYQLYKLNVEGKGDVLTVLAEVDD
ncbi:MAG: methyltransferase domain-containing protein [Acidobacteriota bacterium]|nr:methyltransferase domain-containing protein [Acidobacteriota bacterium]